MSFRLSRLNFCRASIVGLACLAYVSASHGGEGARNIQVVPLHGTDMDTNLDQAAPADPQMFKTWKSMAPHPFQPGAPGPANKPLPRPPQSSLELQRQKELLDRRRNWVFMTPEDYMSDANKGSDWNGTEDKQDKKSGTAMERYYQRLYDADHAAATNALGKLDSDRAGGRTNLLGIELRNSDGRSFGDSPFNNTTPDSDLVQSVKHSDFGDIFGSNDRSALPTPEAIRAEAEQKAHLESFKQLWNIDQPAPTPVATPSPVSVDSGPLFGLSSPGMHPVTPVSAPGAGNSSSQPSAPQPTIDTSRANSRPPHSDFSVPQKLF